MFHYTILDLGSMALCLTGLVATVMQTQLHVFEWLLIHRETVTQINRYYSRAHTGTNHPNNLWWWPSMSQTPWFQHHLYLRGSYHSDNVRDGFYQAEWLSGPSAPLCSSVLSGMDSSPASIAGLSGPACTGSPGGCVNTHSLWVGWKLKGIFHDSPRWMERALPNKRIILLPMADTGSRLGSITRELEVCPSIHLCCCCHPQFLSRHQQHWVSIWYGYLLWWWFFPTDVIWSRAMGSNFVFLFLE